MIHPHEGNPGGWCKVCHLHYDHPDHVKLPEMWVELAEQLEKSANDLERKAYNLRRQAKYAYERAEETSLRTSKQ